MPRRIALNPFIAVWVEGVELAIPTNGTVRTALEAAGANVSAALRGLQVLKEHNRKMIPVRFDRNGQDILSLRLLGGEQIRYTN